MDTILKAKNWKKVKMRPTTNEVVERIAGKRHNPKIIYIMLFGSEARGEATLTSDVDIALISDEPLTRAERLEFTDEFKDIDFPSLNIINTLLSDLESEKFVDVNYHIKRDGVLIYER